MAIRLTAAVEAAVEEQFSEEQREPARALLWEEALPLIGDHGDRVRLAVLQLARGDLTRLRYHWARACVDWRDVLADAHDA
jgi:hypothetical protein